MHSSPVSPRVSLRKTASGIANAAMEDAARAIAFGIIIVPVSTTMIAEPVRNAIAFEDFDTVR